MTKLKNKILIILTLLISLSSVFISATPIHASSNLSLEATKYTYSGVSPNTGTTINHNIFKMNMDDKYVFCIESGIYTDSGGGYIPENFNSAKKESLSKIAYYGYTDTNKTDYDYAVTQIMIWEELGDSFIKTNVPNYHQRKSEIMSQVNKHNLVPSWNNKEVTVEVGKSITLTDSNNILSQMSLTSNPTKTNLNINGNNLTITADKNSKSGTISYQKIPNKEVGASIVYRKPNHQTLVEFHLSNTVSANLKLKVIHFGDLKIKKIDETTGKSLPNATMRFEYNGTVKDIVTDNDGIAKIEHIAEGTIVKVSEIKAPHDYFNKGEIRSITIEPNKTIEVILNNKPQQGTLNLTKTGEKAVNVIKKESFYGEQYQFEFDHQTLEGVTYEIKALEDIIVGDVPRVKAGEIVAMVTTNDKAQINCPRLFLGKYQVTEKSAPNGFLINKKPMNFELTYQDQYIELVSTSLSAENEFQKLKLVLHKNEEIITDWKDNKPILDIIKANDKVFGVFTNEDMIISDTITIPKDSLLNYGTVKNGELTLDQLQYPQGKYYFKELDSGSNHELDLNKYEFEFKSKDHHSFQEIHIFDTYKENSVEVIKNKLHFNKLQFEKSNENAILKENEGYTFNFEGNAKGAIFTLEDDKNKVIQTIKINDDSLGVIENIPVGTFFLKEAKSSSDSYLLSDKILRIESDKNGVKVFDNDELLGEKDISNNTILFELNNYIIKGSVELTKSDIATGKLLPNTKVQILNKEMKVVITGVTNDDGTFKYSKLPKGIYYFKEIKAPNGYQLDNTLLKFEIKENDEIVKCKMTNHKIIIELPKTGDTRGKTIGLFILISIVSGLTFIYLTRRKDK